MTCGWMVASNFRGAIKYLTFANGRAQIGAEVIAVPYRPPFGEQTPICGHTWLIRGRLHRVTHLNLTGC